MLLMLSLIVMTISKGMKHRVKSSISHSDFLSRQDSKEAIKQREEVVACMDSLAKSCLKIRSAWELLSKHRERECPDESIYYLWKKACSDEKKRIKRYRKDYLNQQESICAWIDLLRKYKRIKPLDRSTKLSHLKAELIDFEVSMFKNYAEKQLILAKKLLNE